MKHIKFFLFVIFANFIAESCALAQNSIQTMTFSDSSYTDMIRIRGRGPITGSTVEDFKDYVNENYKGEIIEGIYLDSEGGSLGEALAFGREIRKLRLNTVISNEDHCYSACAYAFLGGRERYLFPERDADYNEIPGQTRLGFHQFSYDILPNMSLPKGYAPNLAQRVSGDVQSVAGILGDYVAEMGVGSEIISLSSKYSGENLFFPDSNELRKMKAISSSDDDVANFILLPSGDSLMAAWNYIDNQVTIACITDGKHTNSPSIILTLSVFMGDETAPEAKNIPLGLQTIIQAKALPWTDRDLQHKHFHAHDWIKNQSWNPVFDKAAFYANTLDGEANEFELNIDQSTAEFKYDGKYFHALMFLPPSDMKKISYESNIIITLLEGPITNWRVELKNNSTEREIILTALRNCL